MEHATHSITFLLMLLILVLHIHDLARLRPVSLLKKMSVCLEEFRNRLRVREIILAIAAHSKQLACSMLTERSQDSPE